MPEAPDLINLGFLSDSERELILEVLRRDEELRMVEDQRVRKLQKELLEVKRKGAKNVSGNYSERSCGRCQEPLSRLVFSNQCKMCNHYVCQNCQTVLPNGSWLCCVCTKEMELKKRTGDWFYNQRINRFSTNPGHNLVRASLKKRPVVKKRETTAEKLLRDAEKISPPPKPVPLPRGKPPVKTDQSSDNSGSIGSSESVEPKDNVSTKPPHSDTESAENLSIISSKNETESGRATPEQPRAHSSIPSSPAASHTSSLTVSVKADVVRTESGNSNTSSAADVKFLNMDLEQEAEHIFKKSVRLPPKKECLSTLDLRDGCDKSVASMGNRSCSVPGLEIQEDPEEEEEDIDRLVNFHRMSMAKSSSSLQSSKSMMSIYSESGDFDSVEVKGDVIFSVKYDEHTQSLHVFIKQCRDLAYGDAARLLSNPYVKCYLLPDKSRQSKRKTSVKKNNVNPVYSETLKYSIHRSHLATRSLLISVWHNSLLGRNAFLGEVEVPLDCRDLESGREEQMALIGKTSSVVQASAFAQYKGELVISLKYVTPKKTTPKKVKGKKAPSEEGGELHVLIKEAKNLVPIKPGGTSDSFVKGHLFPAKAKDTKRKTAVMKKNLNPQYNATFVYEELSLEQLGGMCLELTVWDRGAKLSNDFLGGVRLSSGKGTVKIGKEEVKPESVGEEIGLWQKMMQYPDSWAEGTLLLRSTMGKTKGK